jgi:hypothetical protein
MALIEGSRPRAGGGIYDADVVGYGPYASAGVPASGFLNNVCQKGGLVIDTTNAKLYINTGTLAATVYTVVGTQT